MKFLENSFEEDIKDFKKKISAKKIQKMFRSKTLRIKIQREFQTKIKNIMKKSNLFDFKRKNNNKGEKFFQIHNKLLDFLVQKNKFQSLLFFKYTFIRPIYKEKLLNWTVEKVNKYF